MGQAYLQSDRSDRAKAAGATVAIHVLIGAAFLTGIAMHIDKKPDASLATFDVEPPPPQPREEQRQLPAKAPPAAAGEKDKASPIVAPPTKLPTAQPVAAAPVAGEGSSSRAGAAESGSGTGAGGAGSGSGGGGTGDGGRTGAVLISGRLTSRDYRAIAGSDLPSGSAIYVLLVSPAGRVERCRPAASSGSARVDQSLCAMLGQRLAFRPAMESDGRPIYQDVHYVARWGR